MTLPYELRIYNLKRNDKYEYVSLPGSEGQIRQLPRVGAQWDETPMRFRLGFGGGWF